MGLADATLTTAKLREKALLYESQCRWELAAQCWKSALDHYPISHPDSQLAIRDRMGLAEHAQYCRQMLAALSSAITQPKKDIP